MKIVKAVHLNDIDTCVTLTGAADAGDIVSYIEYGEERIIKVRESIPIWHKMAIAPMEKGDSVYKYGAVIGLALERIEPGYHVHTQNVRSAGTGIND